MTMHRASIRMSQAVLALALAFALLPLATAQAAGGALAPPPAPLARAVEQQPPASPGQQPIYGYFRDPLWPGPGMRFIVAECPIGVGATIIHYCPGLPPLAEPFTPPPPVLAPEVLQCDPWFQYFPVCRRPRQD
jgi:hypothetical protein